MQQLVDFLFSDGGYSPHGFCIAWNVPVLYTHIAADLLIAVSYFAIPAIMLIFLRQRRDPALRAPAVLFVAFITACGISHLMSIVTMYYPFYGLQGVLKLLTGVISAITAIALWKMLPEALRIPAPATLLKAIRDRDREIGERATAQSKLTQRNRQLDQKIEEAVAANRELREFSYAASPDLKSPANTLSLWLQYFEEEYADSLDDEGRASLGEAGRIIGRMRALVDDVLKYARVVNGEPAERDCINLRDIIDDTIEDLKPEIQRAHASMDIGPMPRFIGYTPLVSILIHNLLSNALKFRSPDRAPVITIRGEMRQRPAPAFVLRVKDNGIGIDPSYAERVFSLFQRLHRAEDYEGTGLGLALCRRIAVTHGGGIEVISQEGEGAEFIVTLPQEPAETQIAA
ncbi:ATP-binding protein [Sulfitobacter sp. S190]|uniref:sensor histidine kinase n=1 Tax=Sulfitobacter sp. S190 TaxID=2867022 RepID=UPI0021A299FC|nr:ATP-binding protein [Sulfitobacter sp. S190]UWR23478.1 hypothetical protein K3756_05710 [Sulfitobacter sp. S190]